MRLRGLHGWMGPLALFGAACGGNVVVDGLGSGTGGAPSSTSTGAATSSTTSFTASSTSSTGGTTMTSTGTGNSSGAPCLTTCGAGLMTGIMPCDGLAFTSYTALVACACKSPGCGPECKPDLCSFQPVSPSCLSCMADMCMPELADCKAH